MKTNAFIFHGHGGFPEENWFPWLKAKLEEKGLEVFVPQFPTPEGQSLKAWMDILKPYENKIHRETILIAHSLGAIFLLRLLEQLQSPVKLAVFVGAPIGIKPIKNFESDYEFGNGFDFNWAKIKSAAKNFIVYHGGNDPYVGLANGQKLASNLSVDLNLVPNAGHFNKAAGYLTFDDLYNKLEKYI